MSTHKPKPKPYKELWEGGDFMTRGCIGYALVVVGGVTLLVVMVCIEGIGRLFTLFS